MVGSLSRCAGRETSNFSGSRAYPGRSGRTCTRGAASRASLTTVRPARSGYSTRPLVSSLRGAPTLRRVPRRPLRDWAGSSTTRTWARSSGPIRPTGSVRCSGLPRRPRGRTHRARRSLRSNPRSTT